MGNQSQSPPHSLVNRHTLIAVYRTIAVVTDRQLLRQEQELKIFIAATLLR